MTMANTRLVDQGRPLVVSMRSGSEGNLKASMVPTECKGLEEEEPEPQDVEAQEGPVLVTPTKEELLLGGNETEEEGQELVWIEAEPVQTPTQIFGSRNTLKTLQKKNPLGKVVFLNQESRIEHQRALLKSQEARNDLEESFDINSSEMMKNAFSKALNVRALCQPDVDMEYLSRLRMKGTAAGHGAIQVSTETLQAQCYSEKKQNGKIQRMGVLHPTKFNPKAGLLADKAKAYLEKILPKIPQLAQEQEQQEEQYSGSEKPPTEQDGKYARPVSPTSSIFQDREVEFIQTRSRMQRAAKNNQKSTPTRKPNIMGLTDVFRSKKRNTNSDGEEDDSNDNDEGFINIGPMFFKPRTPEHGFLALESQEEMLPPARPDDTHVAVSLQRDATFTLEQAFSDDCSLASFDGRGHNPHGMPMLSPSRPIMVSVPKLDPTLMRRGSWDSLLEGASLEEVIREHQDDDDDDDDEEIKSEHIARSPGRNKKKLFLFRQKD